MHQSGRIFGVVGRDSHFSLAGQDLVAHPGTHGDVVAQGSDQEVGHVGAEAVGQETAVETLEISIF